MKKLIAAALLAVTITYGYAQSIVAAEFFIDTDPGPGNATPVAVTAGATVNFTATVPTSALSNGFHFAGIRTRDDSGNWGMFEIRGLYISTATSNMPNITAAEFFIDNDPGAGNGTPVTVTPGATPTFVATVPASALSAGFHFVAIRTRDAVGTWGLFETRGFYISSATSNAPDITAAEFFVNTDPGAGNGTPVMVTPGASPTFVATVPASALSPGFHFVAIRTRGADGIWGLFETRGFYISSTTASAANITAAEFFVDTDPGAGNGTPATVTPGATPTFVATVPTAALPPGFHFVAIRTRDAAGSWGLFETRGFYITTQSANMGVVTSGEYFFDTDPGAGNGAPFNFSTPGNTVNENLALPVPPGLSQGNHLLILRVKDANGFWSLMDTARTIDVSGTVTPLRLLSFTGEKINQMSALLWITDNEVNTLHVEVERSKNGIVFSKIGQVASANTSGRHQYAFNDLQPYDGINFYRIKQVDRDGRSSYSPIIKILHGGYGVALQLYPNPVSETAQIQFTGTRAKVTITLFDAQGGQVLQTVLNNQPPLRLSLGALPAGRYTMQVSDGETNATANFIRQ